GKGIEPDHVFQAQAQIWPPEYEEAAIAGHARPGSAHRIGREMDACRPSPSRTENGAQALGLLDDRGNLVSRPTTEEACACQGFESTWALPRCQNFRRRAGRARREPVTSRRSGYKGGYGSVLNPQRRGRSLRQRHKAADDRAVEHVGGETHQGCRTSVVEHEEAGRL